MTCNIFFKNVICDNNKQYRIHTIWNDDSFTLTVFEDFKAFKANVSAKAIKELAKKLETSFDIYVEELRSCLCAQDLSNITFERKTNSFLILKKQDNMIIQFASFTIKESNFQQNAINVIDSMNTLSIFYRKEANDFKLKMDLAEQEKTMYMQKLTEFVNKKKDTEHELYSKFILILNEKKNRIQHLQEMLKQETLNENRIKRTNCESNKIKEKEEISDSETSEDEPAKPITHDVQVETIKKKINFLDNQEDDLTIKNLPKRAKVVSNAEEIQNLTMKEETNNIQNKEIVESPEFVNNNESEDCADFSTQDLIDRM